MFYPFFTFYSFLLNIIFSFPLFYFSLLLYTFYVCTCIVHLWSQWWLFFIMLLDRAFLALITLFIRYHEADMRTGKPTYWQLTSLQAFWPGLQVNIADSCLSLSNLNGKAFMIFFMVVRFLLGTLALLTHHIVNFSMCGRNLVYYQRGTMFNPISSLLFILFSFSFYFNQWTWVSLGKKCLIRLRKLSEVIDRVYVLFTYTSVFLLLMYIYTSVVFVSL